MDNDTVRVLLVEDDEDDYYLTSEMLAAAPGKKIKLDWAKDYDDGLKAIVECSHDAYLLDYRLGARDGLTLLAEALKLGCKGPLIVLTGEGDRELALNALKAGAADFLVKGAFDAFTLERSIRFAMQQARYAEELEEKVHQRTADLERAHAIVNFQKEALQLIVQGATIEQMLVFLAESIESQSRDDFLVAIHLMEADGYHFGFVAAPNLPASYAQATKGMDARLELGTCSSAIMANEPTIVHDFAAETRWPAFTTEMLAIGLRGCFTTPIVSASRKTLGTFAIYYREPRDPNPRDQHLVDIVTRTVAIAVERLQAEEALRKSEDRFVRFMHHLPGLAWIKDDDGRYVYANDAAIDVFNTPRERLYGKTDRELFPPETAGRFEENDSQARSSATGVQAVETLEHKDGTLHHSIVSKFPILDADGKPALIGGMAVDITDRMQAEEAVRVSEERYRTLFDSAPMAVFVCDRNAVIQHYNPVAAELWGREPECGVERHCGSMKLWLPGGELLPHDQSPMVEVLRTGVPAHNIEVFIERPDGSRLPVLVNFAALKDENGEINGAITSFIDITDRKQAEAELRRHTDEIEAFNRLMVGRELRMIELKQEINAMCEQFALPPAYAVDGE